MVFSDRLTLVSFIPLLLVGEPLVLQSGQVLNCFEVVIQHRNSLVCLFDQIAITTQLLTRFERT